MKVIIKQDFPKLKLTLIILRINLSAIIFASIISNTNAFLEDFNKRFDRNDEKSLGFATGVTILAIVMEAIFTVLFVGSIMRNWPGGIIVMTTLCLLSYYADLIFMNFSLDIDSGMDIFELTLALCVIIVGYTYSFLLISQIPLNEILIDNV